MPNVKLEEGAGDAPVHFQGSLMCVEVGEFSNLSEQVNAVDFSFCSLCNLSFNLIFITILLVY